MITVLLENDDRFVTENRLAIRNRNDGVCEEFQIKCLQELIGKNILQRSKRHKDAIEL